MEKQGTVEKQSPPSTSLAHGESIRAILEHKGLIPDGGSHPGGRPQGDPRLKIPERWAREVGCQAPGTETWEIP